MNGCPYANPLHAFHPCNGKMDSGKSCFFCSAVVFHGPTKLLCVSINKYRNYISDSKNEIKHTHTGRHKIGERYASPEEENRKLTNFV